MPSLRGPSLGGSSSGFAQLSVALTADASQGDLVTVTEGATPTGGDGAYSYAWTLHDPHGTARTALLTSATAQAPSWTPDAIAGAWVARVTVTDGQGSTAKAARIVTLGEQGWVQIADFDFALEADQSLSGGALTVSNRAQQGNPSETLTSFNSGSAATLAIASGRLVIAPNATTEIAPTSSTQSAPGLKIALASILTGIAAALKRWGRVLVVVQHDDVAFANNNDVVAVGLSATLGPGEDASSGAGILGGILKQAGGERPRVMSQVDGQRFANTVTTGGGADATGSRVLVLQVEGGYGAQVGWSTDAADADVLADALALVAPGAAAASTGLPLSTAGVSAGDWMDPAQWTLRVYAGTAAALAGGPFSIERLQVFVGGTA